MGFGDPEQPQIKIINSSVNTFIRINSTLVDIVRHKMTNKLKVERIEVLNNSFTENKATNEGNGTSYHSTRQNRDKKVVVAEGGKTDLILFNQLLHRRRKKDIHKQCLYL